MCYCRRHAIICRYVSPLMYDMYVRTYVCTSPLPTIIMAYVVLLLLMHTYTHMMYMLTLQHKTKCVQDMMCNKCELRLSTKTTSHNICTAIMLIVIQVLYMQIIFYFGGGGINSGSIPLQGMSVYSESCAIIHK